MLPVQTPGGPGSPADLTTADLGPLGTSFARGFEAVLHGLPALRLPDVPGPLVYKKYRTLQGSRPGLAALIRARSELDDARRRRLDAVTAWPVRRVVERGTVRGVVLPRVADRFHIDITLPHSGRTERQVHDLQTLLLPVEKALRAGRPAANGPLRMRVARDAAATMAFLHDEMDVVLGDVSPRNTLIDLRGTDRVLFLDCDSMRIVSAPLDQRQPHTPDWDPPHGEVTSRATDVYKLGLIILRILAPRRMASVDRDPKSLTGVLDAAGMDLLRRAIDSRGPSDERPTAHEWFVHLSQALGEPVRPPSLCDVSADPTLLVPGTSTTVRWTLDTPALVEVHSAGVAIAAVDAPAGAGCLDAVPYRTGALTVSATNPFGEDAARTAGLVVLEPPVTRDLPVSIPQFALPDLARPMVPAPAPPPVPVGFIDAMRLPPLPPPFPAPTAADVIAGVDGSWTRLPPLPIPDPDAAPFDLLEAMTTTPDPHRGLPPRERAHR